MLNIQFSNINSNNILEFQVELETTDDMTPMVISIGEETYWVNNLKELLDIREEFNRLVSKVERQLNNQKSNGN